MTLVRLERLWINRADDPADSVVVDYWRDSAQAVVPDGSVRTYAGGRRRNVSGKGREETWTPLLPPMALDVAQELYDRAGVRQWFRDPFGGKVLGVYRNPVRTHAGLMHTRRYGRVQHATLALTITVLTGDEVPRG